MDRKAELPLYKSILAAFMILIMHVLLLGGIGVLVLFFYGIVNHMAWMIFGVLCLSGGGYWLYKRVKSDGKALKEMVGGSFKGKTIEVSLLGRLATFKICDSQFNRGTDRLRAGRGKQLPGPDLQTIGTLPELARLYEKKLITSDEYKKAKQEILK